MGSNRDVIHDVLRQLVDHTFDEEFVIFEDADTGKFVQFAAGLLFDLPVPTDDPQLLHQADRFFAACGLPVSRQDIPGFVSFSIEFGQRIEEAADFAVRVFKDVHQLPEHFRLEVKS